MMQYIGDEQIKVEDAANIDAEVCCCRDIYVYGYV